MSLNNHAVAYTLNELRSTRGQLEARPHDVSADFKRSLPKRRKVIPPHRLHRLYGVGDWGRPGSGPGRVEGGVEGKGVGGGGVPSRTGERERSPLFPAPPFLLMLPADVALSNACELAGKKADGLYSLQGALYARSEYILQVASMFCFVPDAMLKLLCTPLMTPIGFMSPLGS